jgi:EAL domain-containing protein (putative c-di-GMP-specific phosphodiesterase class I)
VNRMLASNRKARNSYAVNPVHQDITVDAIRAGLIKGEFFVEYLPTISLVNGVCIGAEALTRWKRPSGVV